MAKLPIVALIGRPNTGKSTLFNRLIGHRRAIVSEVPGTTRDPVASRVEGETVDYLLVDTGGMGGGTLDKDFEDDVQAQSILALEGADLILFVVNGREELTAADYEVVSELRKKRRRHVQVILVIAKCDDPVKAEDALPRFYELHITDKVLPVSALHALGIDELSEVLEEELRKLHFGKALEEDVSGMQCVALVGRPNVGKSSIVNALMSDVQRKEEARITSEIPGTTRDTTDTIIRHEGKDYLFLDTAGLRRGYGRQAGLQPSYGRQASLQPSYGRQAGLRRGGGKSELAGSKFDEKLEVFAALRTLQAIEGAHVTVLVLDPVQGIGRQDKRIANLAIERGTGLVLLVNKTDILSAEERKVFRTEVTREFSFCKWAPVLYSSAHTREHLPKLFELIDTVSANRKRRIETAKINRWFQDISALHQPKDTNGRVVKTKYVTQVSIEPPTFALFLHDPKRLHFSSVRYVENQLRKDFAFEGTPVRWVKRGRE